jgi:hypothetical protein
MDVKFWNGSTRTYTGGKELLLCINFAAKSIQITGFFGNSRIAVIVEKLQSIGSPN